MGAAELAFLAGAGVLAGIVSVVVSLASVVSYPALLAVGLPPVAANVTNTVALVFTGIGSVAGSRQELAGQRSRLVRSAAVTAVGGAGGAALLLLSPPSTFESVAPYLIATASLVLLLQPRVRASLARRTAARGGRGGRGLLRRGLQGAALCGVAVYVGYFGAAGGVLMLAVLGSLVDEPLPVVNALKNAASGAANTVAALGFAAFGPVEWAAAAPLAAGFLLGGWLGPGIVRRMPAPALRLAVAGCGLAVAVALWLGDR